MHAVNVVGEALDHRVVEVIERGGEAVLLGLRRQAAEQVAQRLGVGGQQRPDQCERAGSTHLFGGYV
jgi:hypothetical protein